jgi:hypothetical protein
MFVMMRSALRFDNADIVGKGSLRVQSEVVSRLLRKVPCGFRSPLPGTHVRNDQPANPDRERLAHDKTEARQVVEHTAAEHTKPKHGNPEVDGGTLLKRILGDGKMPSYGRVVALAVSIVVVGVFLWFAVGVFLSFLGRSYAPTSLPKQDAYTTPHPSPIKTEPTADGSAAEKRKQEESSNQVVKVRSGQTGFEDKTIAQWESVLSGGQVQDQRKLWSQIKGVSCLIEGQLIKVPTSCRNPRRPIPEAGRCDCGPDRLSPITGHPQGRPDGAISRNSSFVDGTPICYDDG